MKHAWKWVSPVPLLKNAVAIISAIVTISVKHHHNASRTCHNVIKTQTAAVIPACAVAVINVVPPPSTTVVQIFAASFQCFKIVTLMFSLPQNIPDQPILQGVIFFFKNFGSI